MKRISVDAVRTNLSGNDFLDPFATYKAAAEALGREGCFILESLAGPKRDRQYSMIGFDKLFGVRVFCDRIEIVAEGELLAVLTNQLSRLLGKPVDGHRFSISTRDDIWNALRVLSEVFQLPDNADFMFGFFGYFGYETAWFIERLPDLIGVDKSYPVISLGVFQTYAIHRPDGSRELIINNSSYWETKSIEDYKSFLASEGVEATAVQAPISHEVEFTIDKESYLRGVDYALEKIRIGDIYQIQLGHEIKIRSSISPTEVYRKLRESNPSPYMYLCSLEGVDLVGASPELFVRLQSSHIEMRPIAGTVGKTRGIARDELVRSLTDSVKERAEHVMLVDLCRNDIGRICLAGTLDADELMVVEEYSHLYHMVSNVTGKLDQSFDRFDVIKATFPAGTMTGAPKIRAMELIEEIETSKRGIYAGAVGVVGFNETLNTALCIRTAVHQDGVYTLRASAGIVSDSVPEKEWNETMYKMGSVYRAISGKELVS